MVAANAWPARIARDGTLHVNTSSSAWAFELGQLAPTILERLSEKLGVPQISTGDLFRQNIGDGTPLGLEAKRYLDAGDLVPSELTNKLVEDRIEQDDAAAGFILDGYPRSVEQAKALDDMLKRHGTELIRVRKEGA